jgi:hypothetical protein
LGLGENRISNNVKRWVKEILQINSGLKLFLS